MPAAITIVDYTMAYAQVFKALNEAWINRYFELEEEDIRTLNHPEKILDQGGFIFVALINNKPVGVCALKRQEPDTFELIKMAVAEDFQGAGIGRRLGESAIRKAKTIGADRIYLEGNTALASSIHLYKKLGFTEIQSSASPYQRVNIVMELRLR